ncbi:zinc finger ZZ-type and EF-hand domain-containing protein 1-like isoform X2 [Asterias amurensis]|uniref:zinc finger ZZ-type and EF-hand domain-containing protein 1-like isoform X2 n=1 Tax=Asterias amurensis TaxID=7602 RepID=UPI003AB3DC0E
MMGSATSTSTSSSDSDDDSSSFELSDGEGQKVTPAKSDTEGDKNELDLSQLFNHTSLREAASKIRDDIPETVPQQHHGHILRWLEDREQRHEEIVSLSQFCDLLMTRGVGREDCVEAFGQFDVDGEGYAEVAAMLESLKSSNGANLKGELTHVIRTLQACSLTPGLVDVYTSERESVGHQGKRLVKYVLRNRAPSTGLPFFYLDGFNNIITMRLSVLGKYLNQKQKESALKELTEEEGGIIKVINKCYKWIRVSTSSDSAQWLEDREPSTYWQSNGHARSHWIRLRLKDDICLQHLSIKVAQTDQSYMPQHIVVLTGRNPNSLHTVREVSIPNNITGEVTLLENAHVTSPLVQINITRCHSDGCDVRIHGLKTVGFRSIANSEVSVKDASVAWYFDVLASTATVAMATSPPLRSMILQHTRTALSHMPPMSLSTSQVGRNSFPSPHVLDKTEDFLYNVARNSEGRLDIEGIKILLELGLARGSVVRIIKALQLVLDGNDEKISAVKLMKSLNTVTEKMLRKYATQFTVTLAGCDGGQKESSSGPANVLSSSWTSDSYLSEKTKVNMFFTSETPFYLTKLQIKVCKGAIGAKAGFIFVYDDKEEFDLARSVAKFEMYDAWTAGEYRILHGLRSASIAGKPDNPVAYFTLGNDWDEVEIHLDELTLGRYILIKFLRPRDTAERLGILGVRFYGHVTNSSAVDNMIKILVAPLPFDQEATINSAELCIRVLHFVVRMTKNQDLLKKVEGNNAKMATLDMQSVSLGLITKLYHSIPTSNSQWMLIRMLTLKLLHHSYPCIMNKLEADTAKHKLKKIITQALPAEQGGALAAEEKDAGKPDWLVEWEDCSQKMFTHLCDLVNQDPPPDSPEMLLKEAAKEAILDGAAVFFPDKDTRKKELFRLMNLLSSNVEAATNLVFQSLCHHFGSIDPSGLLNLPTNPTEENFDDHTVLNVVKTLQSVVFKEFVTSLGEPSQLTSGQSYVCRLLGAVQASFMAWCKDILQPKTPNPAHVKIAHNAILKYTKMQCEVSVKALNSLHAHLVKQQEEFKQKQDKTPDKQTQDDNTKEVDLEKVKDKVQEQLADAAVSNTAQQDGSRRQETDEGSGVDSSEGPVLQREQQHHTAVDSAVRPDPASQPQQGAATTSQLAAATPAVAVTDQQQPQQAAEQTPAGSSSEEPAKKLGMEEELQILVEQRQERVEQQQLQQCRMKLKQQQQKLIDALQHSFLGTIMRQLTLMLILLSDQNLNHSIINDIMQVSIAVKKLQQLLGDDFNEIPADDFKEGNTKKEKVTLRKWDIESAHRYPHNQHVTQIFNCPGAQTFQVDFDSRCETELRYDYLEFTDSYGNKTRYDQKVGSDKWPVSVTFKSPVRLQFLFHSDGSNNEWGYKFTVTAKGSRDIQISWLYDLQLSLAKLQGKLCACVLNPPKAKKPEASPSATTDPEEGQKTAATNLLKGELWRTLFRGGHEVIRLTRSLSGIHRTEPIESVINSFLVEVAYISQGASLKFIKRCREQYHMPSVGGELVNDAVMSVFAALLWHSQELREIIPNYVDGDSTCKPSDGIIQAFRTAEGLRPLLIDLRQKRLAAKENDPNMNVSELEPVEIFRDKARFLLQFAGLTKLEKKLERKCSELYTRSKSLESRAFQERQTSSERNAAFQGTAEEGTVLSQYPEFKLVLDFVKNPHLTVERVRDLLKERQDRASAVAEIYQIACKFLKTNGEPSIFQTDCVQFLKEMLHTRHSGETHYASGLDGCGLELEASLRRSFYLLVRSLVKAIENFDCTEQSEEVQMGYACMQACLLHILDVDWQRYDLQFLCDIKAPLLLLNISKRNMSIRDRLVSAGDEAKQLEVHKQCLEWYDEFQDNEKFLEWFDNIAEQASPEERRARQMFVARYCNQLPSISMMCDGCNITLPGAHYRCLECEAFDYCYACYFGGVQTEGHLDEHPMVNFRYNCDSCHGFIAGTRIHCNVCDDFDLCYGCNHAQKFPDGHTAAHSTEIFTMTTVTSGNQQGGMLESYSHHHSWLLFCSLALSVADMVRNTHSQDVNVEYVQNANKLFQQCIELATNCLPTVAQTAISLKEQEDKKTDETEKTEKTEKTEETEETEEKEDKEKSTETTDKKPTEALQQPESESKVLLQEKAFTVSSQERVLGLLAAMLLENTPRDGSSLRQVNIQELHIDAILPLLLRMAKERNTHDNITHHQTVALLGQLLIHIPPRDADKIVRLSQALQPKQKSSSTKEEDVLETVVEAAGAETGIEETGGKVEEEEEVKIDGALTVDFLFDLGASCLEKSGLEWTSLIANILQHLCLMPSWQVVIAKKISESIGCLPKECPLPCIFALFVVAGFPEVLCLGSAARYSESTGEQSNVIVIRHLVEKNRAIVTDVRTRKKKHVKEYKLIVDEEFGQSLKPDEFSFFITITKDILTQLKEGAELNVETVWVLYLIIKAILANIKGLDGAEKRLQLLTSNLLPLLVHLASQATKLNRQWILRDLEILSIRLYTHDKSGPSSFSRSDDPVFIDSDNLSSHDEDNDKDNSDINNENEDSDDISESDFKSTSTFSESSGSGYATPDSMPLRAPPPVPGQLRGSSTSSQGGIDPLEGIEDKAKIFMHMTNEALQTPLPILRAIYEKSGHNLETVETKIQEWFLEDGSAGVSSDIKELAKRWEPKNNTEKSSKIDLKSVDSGAVAFSSSSSLPKPTKTPHEAIAEPMVDMSLKLIASSEKALRESYQWQQRSRSADLLKKELNTHGKTNPREHLHKINYAISIMYARHLLAALLADWPSEGHLINTATLGCTEPAQMVSVLDLLQRDEEKEVLKKVVSNVVSHCQPELLAPLTVAACTFMEEASMAPVIRESLHKYKNDTKDEGHVTIAGATFLSIKFDERCSTEEECDELSFAADSSFKQDRHEFSGGRGNWNDFEIPGDTVYYKFTSDSSNNDWGFKFTVIGNRLGRFDTGYIILNTVLSKQGLARHIALQELWAWLVHVACRQTAQYRLKTIEILLQVLHTLASAKLVNDSATIDLATAPDLGLLKPLWRLLEAMNEKLVPDAATTTLPPLQRALTELFIRAENLAFDWGVQQEYAISLVDEDKILSATVQGIRNVAAIGLAIGIPNKASRECQTQENLTRINSTGTLSTTLTV